MSAPPSGVSASVPATAIGADTRSTFVSLGAPLSSVPPIVDTKAVSIASVVTSAGAPPTSAGGGIGQSYTAAVRVAAPPAPTVVVKQPEPMRPYTGTTSYKVYKEYFEKICVYDTIRYEMLF